MEIISNPRQYMSVFGEPCFVLRSSEAPLDVQIFSDGEWAGGIPGRPMTVGVKRIYQTGETGINVGPYVTGGLKIEPVVGSGEFAPTAMPRRMVWCTISANGIQSGIVKLTGGTHDASMGMVLSAAPDPVSIRPGERDEMTVITEVGSLRVDAVWYYDGGEYEANLSNGIVSNNMIVVPIDADALVARFTLGTGLPGDRVNGVRIRLSANEANGSNGSNGTWDISRNYTIDRETTGGRRLAWVNRYGAVDYYTFPIVAASTFSGSRSRIETPEGTRTVATSGGGVEKLLSGPCDPVTAEWLSEIYSSPAVWIVRGSSQSDARDGGQNGVQGGFEKVEVAGGRVECTSSIPSRVAVEIGPARKTVSRKF